MGRDRIYFVSDMHFGADAFGPSIERERKFVAWLDTIADDARTIYMLGDVFDFWYEYKGVVPRGFTRFLGKIAALSDAGVDIHFFTGNHDIWIFDYLPEELGITVHREPLTTVISGKNFFLAHGDGLGDDSLAFRFIRGFFHNRICQKLFSLIHPSFGVWLAHRWARHSRLKEFSRPVPYLGEEREHLVRFAKRYISEHTETDYLIFGHRHILLDLQLSRRSRMMIIGDWLQYFSYAVFDGRDLTLETV